VKPEHGQNESEGVESSAKPVRLSGSTGGLSAVLAVLLSLLVFGPATVESQTLDDIFSNVTRRNRAKKAPEKGKAEVLFQEETEEEKLIDAFTLRHVKFSSDWNPDPTALPQLEYQFRKTLRMRCKFLDDPIELSDPEIFKWPILWMHAHMSFQFSEKERDNLKKYLRRGGVLFADDCSAGEFGGWLPSFRAEVDRMFPGQPFIRLTPDNKRFKTLFNISYKFADMPKNISADPDEVFLVNNRVAIYLGMDDYGCQWEVRSPPTSANPLGTGLHLGNNKRKTGFEFSFNILLYLLSH
jgi:hypothetical protein